MTLSIERRKQRADFERVHNFLRRKPLTHAQIAARMYDAGKRDKEGGFPRTWSMGRCQCDGCVRSYNAGYDDGKEAE